MGESTFWIANIISVILGSGIATAILHLFFEDHQRKKEQKANARYLALKIAFQIEDYSISCLHIVDEHFLYLDSAGSAGKLKASLPIVPGLPDSDSYNLIDPEILHWLFVLTQCQDNIESCVDFYFQEISEIDAGYKLFLKGLNEVGLKSFIMARRLRLEHSLPPRSINFAGSTLEERYSDNLERLESFTSSSLYYDE